MAAVEDLRGEKTCASPSWLLSVQHSLDAIERQLSCGSQAERNGINAILQTKADSIIQQLGFLKSLQEHHHLELLRLLGTRSPAHQEDHFHVRPILPGVLNDDDDQKAVLGANRMNFIKKQSSPDSKRRGGNATQPVRSSFSPKSNGQALSEPNLLAIPHEEDDVSPPSTTKIETCISDELTKLRTTGCGEKAGTIEDFVVSLPGQTPEDYTVAPTLTSPRTGKGIQAQDPNLRNIRTEQSLGSEKYAKQASRVISSHKGRRDGGQHGISAYFSSGTEKSILHTAALKVVNHTAFDMVVAAAILLNGVVVGAQTHVMAVDDTDEAPVFYEVVELIFCAVFTVELAIRLFALRLKFFTMPGTGWNIFDLVVVSAQLLELLMEAVGSGLGFSINLMRTLRLVRVLRIARTLRLIGELRTIVSSIVSSMKPLFWTGVLLFMVVYVLGVYVTQVVLHTRMDYKEKNLEAPADLILYWGDLVKSIFSLFQSITGGVDWDAVARPLIDRVGPEMGVLYSLYITFTMFAMLNVVTGVFIQAVIENATAETEYRTRIQVKNLFQNLDSDHSGEITWEKFETQLQRKEMQAFFKTIDVDISNAKALFDLLDIDASGSVDCDEFLEGCLRLWAPSRGYDQRMILRDVNILKSTIEAGIQEGKFGGDFSRVDRQDVSLDSVADLDFAPNATVDTVG